eukprot:scaffold28040_cov70-Isochrysis_galbana.AAC.1
MGGRGGHEGGMRVDRSWRIRLCFPAGRGFMSEHFRLLTISGSSFCVLAEFLLPQFVFRIVLFSPAGVISGPCLMGGVPSFPAGNAGVRLPGCEGSGCKESGCKGSGCKGKWVQGEVGAREVGARGGSGCKGSGCKGSGCKGSGCKGSGTGL